MNLQTIIGIAASVFTGISMLPQLVKVVKEKKAEDISAIMLVVLLVGLSAWIWYGFLKKDYILIVSNSFSLLVNVALSVMAVKYKKGG